ncbi:MAG: hypothetical protein Q9212_003441 [Teloschistes hypoglaucus]
MFSSTIIAGLLLGLSQIQGGLAQPVNTQSVNSSSFIINHSASDYFPDAKGDMSLFDVNVRFAGYNASTQSWLESLNPADATSDLDKAKMITAAAYAKPYDANDADMINDVDSMMAAIDGKPTTLVARGFDLGFDDLERRQLPRFVVSAAHAVTWASCAGVYDCLSGKTCGLGFNPGKAPRSDCVQRGGSNCCISWSDYSVRVGFFTTAWTRCNQEVNAEHKVSASCEGYGGRGDGGDVCFSNRANGCT